MDFTFNDEQTGRPRGRRRNLLRTGRPPPGPGGRGHRGPDRPGAVGRARPGRPVGPGRPHGLRRGRLRDGRAVPAAGGPGQVVAPVPVGHARAGGASRRRFGSDPTAVRAPARRRVRRRAAHRRAGRRGRRHRRGGEGRPRCAARSPPTVLRCRVRHAVPYAHVAARVLVPVATDGGTVVAVVDPTATGVTLERASPPTARSIPTSTSTGWPWPSTPCWPGATPPGPRSSSWMLQRAWTGLCALQVGITESAVAQTAEYLNDPQQFGRAAGHVPGHQDAGGRRRHRHRSDPGDDVAGRLAPRRRPRRRPGRQCGLMVRRRVQDSGWSSPPSTSMAAWAPTSRTRSTATSCGASRSSSCSARPSARWPDWADSGGGPGRPRRCRHEQGRSSSTTSGRPPGPWTR